MSPLPANIRWSEVESMLLAMGIEVRQRSGSRVMLRFGEYKYTVHLPHPSPNMRHDRVRDLVKFLRRIGVVP